MNRVNPRTLIARDKPTQPNTELQICQEFVLFQILAARPDVSKSNRRLTISGDYFE